VAGDDWLRKASGVNEVLLGYSQSWALFHMLMEERPKGLRRYLALIYPRQTPERRLEDFAEVFGRDLGTFETRYHAYMKEIVRQQAR
jgi:hypothetical protein